MLIHRISMKHHHTSLNICSSLNIDGSLRFRHYPNPNPIKDHRGLEHNIRVRGLAHEVSTYTSSIHSYSAGEIVISVTTRISALRNMVYTWLISVRMKNWQIEERESLRWLNDTLEQNNEYIRCNEMIGDDEKQVYVQRDKRSLQLFTRSARGMP